MSVIYRVYISYPPKIHYHFKINVVLYTVFAVTKFQLIYSTAFFRCTISKVRERCLFCTLIFTENKPLSLRNGTLKSATELIGQNGVVMRKERKTSEIVQTILRIVLNTKNTSL